MARLRQPQAWRYATLPTCGEQQLQEPEPEAHAPDGPAPIMHEMS